MIRKAQTLVHKLGSNWTTRAPIQSNWSQPNSQNTESPTNKPPLEKKLKYKNAPSIFQTTKTKKTPTLQTPTTQPLTQNSSFKFLHIPRRLITYQSILTSTRGSLTRLSHIQAKTTPYQNSKSNNEKIIFLLMKKRFLFGQVHREKALPPNQNQKAWETQDFDFSKGTNQGF